MKLRELIEVINKVNNSPLCNDAEVMIVVSEGGIPSTPCVKVTNVGLGFDWDHGKFMIRPEEPLIRKQVKKGQK